MGRASHSQASWSESETAGRPTATLEEVDIRAELDARACRSPNYDQEDRAYRELAREMAENPRNLLQKLVEVAVDLCRAGTAGVSLLEGDSFRWEAVAGASAAARGRTMPRNESPCGVCIDRDAVQLMHFADRCFPALLAEPRFAEALLIPFHHCGRPIGTVWVVSHSVDRKFDKEDERVARVLSQFASAGWQLWKAYESADEANRRKDDVVATLDRREVERTANPGAMETSSSTRDAVERIRAAYLEMPGLRLTVEQVRRLCGVERTMCSGVLDSLVQARFLCVKADGSYTRLTDGAIHDSRSAHAGSKSHGIPPPLRDPVDDGRTAT